MSDANAPRLLPSGWSMTLPGYAVDQGQTKSERALGHVVRTCDARGCRVRTYAEDGRGVPVDVVLACIGAAREWPPEFKP
jgi:hypothetical protein